MDNTATTTPADGPDPVDRHVGARIAALRDALGQTQSDLATACGISFQQIQKYESGANRVSCSRLVQIALAQGQAPGSYFEGIELLQRESTSESDAVRWASRWLMTPQALELAVAFASIDNRQRAFAVFLAHQAVAYQLKDRAADAKGQG